MRRALIRTLLTSAALVLVAPAARAQVPAGGEFLIKSPPANTAADLAVHPGGAFVVVWQQADGAYYSVIGQRFDARAIAQGEEFQVTASPGDHLDPLAAVFPNGRLAVVWFKSLFGLFGRVVDASGAPASGEFKIAQSSQGHFPSLAITSPSRFVVAWKALGDGSQDAVFARYFDEAGNALSPEFVVNVHTYGSQNEPSVSAAADGSFVVVWTSVLQDGSGEGVFGRRFDAAGQPLGLEFAVNAYTTGDQGDAQVASDAAGNFVVVWQRRLFGSLPLLVGRRFAASGVALGAEFVVNTFSTSSFNYSVTSLASDRAGNFTVAWFSRNDGAAWGVRARRYSATGDPRGDAFQVNVSTAGDQALGDVASDAVGNLFATWITTHIPPQPQQDILGRRYGGLLPAALAVADGENGVLEVADDFTLVTAWRNANGAAQTFEGHASPTAPSPGLSLTLSADASYGTVADGAVAACVGPCFTGALSGLRPPGHVDLGFVEAIQPDAHGQAQPWLLHVGDTFADVPRPSVFYRSVETLLHHGVTAGCGSVAFCPLRLSTRQEISALVLLAREGSAYVPAACTTAPFTDVPITGGFCPWIAEVARRGIVAGCGGGNYCPGGSVTRQEMAVFALATLDPIFEPPPCTVPPFTDVPTGSPFCPYIAELARRGVLSGCGGGNYCPAAPVMRQEMAVFIIGTFGLELYGP